MGTPGTPQDWFQWSHKLPVTQHDAHLLYVRGCNRTQKEMDVQCYFKCWAHVTAHRDLFQHHLCFKFSHYLRMAR